MPTHEIPHEQWPRFLGDFSVRHFGREVRLEQRKKGGGRLIEADHRYLQQLTAEQAGVHGQISIMLGNPFEQHQTHVVDEPTHLRVGKDHELEIDAKDGSTTTLQLTRGLDTKRKS